MRGHARVNSVVWQAQSMVPQHGTGEQPTRGEYFAALRSFNLSESHIRMPVAVCLMLPPEAVPQPRDKGGEARRRRKLACTSRLTPLPVRAKP